MPRKRAALHSPREFAQSLEYGQLAQPSVRIGSPGHKRSKTRKQISDFTACSPFNTLRHQRCGRFRYRAALALKTRIRDPITVHAHVDRNPIAAKRVVSFGTLRTLQRFEV